MIDNNIFISSATLIPDMYNDYNIQSDDFVSRFPIWIANAGRTQIHSSLC